MSSIYKLVAVLRFVISEGYVTVSPLAETRSETLARWSRIDDALDPSGLDSTKLDHLDPELAELVQEIDAAQHGDDLVLLDHDLNPSHLQRSRW